MATDKLKLPSYGGQALIEGVLMRGSQNLAAAFRAPDGSIVVEKEKLEGIYKSRLAKIPFLRGLVILWDALGLGTRYLTKSANIQSGEDEQIEGTTLFLSLALSFGIAIALVFVAPAALGKWIADLAGWSAFWASAIEGVVRLLIVVGYIWAIGFMKDIARVFAYHGAEHKTINAFEAGAELRPEVVQTYSLQHPRCGTAFLLTLVIFSVIAFALIGSLPFGWTVLSRIVLIPVLAMMAYEYIRWTANHLDSPVVRTLAKPSLALQKLTTREPSLDMLEISIAAFNAMLQEEKEATQAAP